MSPTINCWDCSETNCGVAGGKLHAPVVNPADKYEDKSVSLHTYGQYLLSCLPKYIQQFSVWKDELTIYIPPSGVIPVISFLKYHSAAEYTMIVDITAVDYPTRDQRFEVIYNLLSIRHNSRIRVKTYADEATPVPSICGLYDGANWYEREVYDLFGVFFVGHPDLRRIMTDYGFDGHPLRKDFPMTGYTEIRYDEEKKRIVVEPLELSQAFRNFEGGTAAWEQVGPGKERTPDQVRKTLNTTHACPQLIVSITVQITNAQAGGEERGAEEIAVENTCTELYLELGANIMFQDVCHPNHMPTRCHELTVRLCYPYCHDNWACPWSGPSVKACN